MPVITLSTLELLDEQKMEIAQKFTKILSDLTKVPQEKIYVMFQDFPINSIAAGGHLVSEYPISPDSFITKYTSTLKKTTGPMTRPLAAKPAAKKTPAKKHR